MYKRQDLQKLLPHRRVAVLHGRMKNTEKDQIMRDFAAQKYDILVATTEMCIRDRSPSCALAGQATPPLESAALAYSYIQYRIHPR